MVKVYPYLVDEVRVKKVENDRVINVDEIYSYFIEQELNNDSKEVYKPNFS